MSYIDWLRQQIGHQKTILVYSTVVVQDREERVLLQRRSDFPWWGLPGGILEYGEDILSCARRELMEETGLETENLRLVGVYTLPRYDVTYPNGDEVQQFSVCFTGVMTGGALQPDGDETLALAFYYPDDLPGMDIPIWYRAMLNDALNMNEATFEWEGPASADAVAPATQKALQQVPGYILPVAVAVVEREDGHLFLPEIAAGQRRLPMAAMCLGETVASTAVRAAAEYLDGELWPQRLLGIVSTPGIELSMAGWTKHTVAAVFLLRAKLNTIDDKCDQAWLTSEKWPAALEQAGLHRLLVEALRGGQFVDGIVTDCV